MVFLGYGKFRILFCSSLEIPMHANPYEPSTASNRQEMTETTSTSSYAATSVKSGLIIIGMSLFFSNVQRDAHFYRTILENEGFPTSSDSIAIGIAGSLISTVVFTPVALFLTWYGFGNCKRLQIVSRFDRFTFGWGIFASILLILMLMIEADYLIYAAQRPQHWKTLLASSAYVVYIYVWWCNSLAHGKVRTNKAMRTEHAIGRF